MPAVSDQQSKLRHLQVRNRAPSSKERLQLLPFSPPAGNECYTSFFSFYIMLFACLCVFDLQKVRVLLTGAYFLLRSAERVIECPLSPQLVQRDMEVVKLWRTLPPPPQKKKHAWFHVITGKKKDYFSL